MNKNIFICWFQGIEHLDTHPKSIIFKENIKNWQLLNPEWKVKIVTDKDLQNACKLFSKKCFKLYNSFDLIHLKIDLGRYVLLYLYGGIYVDMDMYVLRGLNTSEKINNLLNKASNGINVLGLSSLNLSSQESFIFIGRSRVINNAMMISSPKNPLLFSYIKTIISNSKNFKSSDNSFSKISNITGPIFINKIFGNYLDYPLDNSIFYIEIFDHFYFEPSPPIGNSDIREETIAIHKMEMTWIQPCLKNYISFYFKFKPLLQTFISLILIYIINKIRKKIN